MKTQKNILITLFLLTISIISDDISCQTSSINPSYPNYHLISDNTNFETTLSSNYMGMNFYNYNVLRIFPGQLEMRSSFGYRNLNLGLFSNISGRTKGQLRLTGNSLNYPEQEFQSLINYQNHYCPIGCGNWEIGIISGSNLWFRFDRNSVAYIDYNGVYRKVSDKNLKKNIRTLKDQSILLNKLKGYKYKMKQSSGKKEEFGFLAQELLAIFPELVSTNNTGSKKTLMVDYQGVIPIIIKVIQEQNTKLIEENANILEMQSRIENLMFQLNKH